MKTVCAASIGVVLLLAGCKNSQPEPVVKNVENQALVKPETAVQKIDETIQNPSELPNPPESQQ